MKKEDEKLYALFYRYSVFAVQLVMGPVVFLGAAQWLGNRVGYKTGLILLATLASLGWMVFQAIQLNKKAKP